MAPKKGRGRGQATDNGNGRSRGGRGGCAATEDIKATMLKRDATRIAADEQGKVDETVVPKVAPQHIPTPLKQMATPAKKAKVADALDPFEELCSSVAVGFKDATDDLPSACHDLFHALAVGSLPAPKDDRHPLQDAAIEILAHVAADIEGSRTVVVNAEHEKVAAIAKNKAFLDEECRVCESKLSEKQADANLKSAAHLRACEASDEASSALVAAVAQKEKHATEAVSIVEEQAACKAALDFEIVLIKDGASIMKNGVFVRPDDPKHLAKLRLLVANIDLDQTLVEAFPTAAEKAPVFRSDFDKSVLDQIEKALAVHAEALQNKIATSDPAAVAAEDAKVVSAAEALCETASERVEATREMLRSSQEEAAAVEAEAINARRASDEAAKSLHQAETALAAARWSLLEFQKGPALTFKDLRDRSDGTEVGTPRTAEEVKELINETVVATSDKPAEAVHAAEDPATLSLIDDMVAVATSDAPSVAPPPAAEPR